MDPEEELDYHESEDEDFNPEAQAAEENVSSSDEEEDEASAVKAKNKKQAPTKRSEQHIEELDSGDEATIEESKRRKKRRKDADAQEDSGGEGGLIKTRAQRKAEKEERKEYARTHKGNVTIDVDAVWASLMSVPVGRPTSGTTGISEVEEPDSAVHDSTKTMSIALQPDESDFVTIKHSYQFAGQTINEEKQVHRDSAEAKLFLANTKAVESADPIQKMSKEGVLVRRPLKRASMFEPNPTGEVKGLPVHKQRLRTPSRADVIALQKRIDEENKAAGGKTQRLNTVQKSKLDWASHVDAEGLKDELNDYGRSKQGYMEKMDFLQNVQGRRDNDERQARLQGVH